MYQYSTFRIVLFLLSTMHFPDKKPASETSFFPTTHYIYFLYFMHIFSYALYIM